MYLKKPTNIEPDNKLMLFRKGCTPLWEVKKSKYLCIFQLKNKIKKGMEMWRVLDFTSARLNV